MSRMAHDSRDPTFVGPANAGTRRRFGAEAKSLGPRFRGDDEIAA